MKYYAMMLMASLSLGLTSCSDDDNSTDVDLTENEVPSVVKNSFEEQFPTATDVDWEVMGTDYEADFEIEMVEYNALIEADGDLIKYKYDIAATALPEAVTATIVADYENKPVDGTEILIIDDNTYYQVELDDEPSDIELVFDESGEVNTEVVYYD